MALASLVSVMLEIHHPMDLYFCVNLFLIYDQFLCPSRFHEQLIENQLVYTRKLERDFNFKCSECVNVTYIDTL